MKPPTRLAAFAVAILAAHAAAAGPAARRSAAPPPGPGAWHTLLLPAPAERLCEAVDFPAPSAPEDLLFNLVRVLHERPLDAGAFARGRAAALLRLLRSPAAGDASARTPVPLPLAPQTWARTILGRRAAPAALAGAILADRRASLLYVGLGLVDAGTLAALERMPDLLAQIDERRASVLAAFGRSLAIRDDGVRVPGPPEAWAALAGAPPSDAPRFVEALLDRDRGRVAYFLDALTRLDPPHLRFALAEPSDRAAPAAGLRPLYEVFRRVSPEWDAAQYPFYRPPLDPASLLAAFRVTAGGRLAPPASRALWEAAFRGDAATPDTSASAPDTADAVWLLDAVLAAGPKGAPARAAQVRFAQRVFAGAEADASLCAAIAGYAKYPALMLALERMGLAQPSVYAHAASVAAALTRRGDPADLALFQASVALIDRGAWSGALGGPEAARLAGSLLRLDARDDQYDARIARWLSDDLLPALAASTGADAASGVEPVVLRALAGVRAGSGAAPVLEWAGRRFRVDAPAGEMARLVVLRRRQGPPTLEQALSGYGVGRRAGAGATRDVLLARRAELADVLVALTYLPYLGDPDGPARLGGRVDRRHLFAAPDAGDRAEPAWRMPVEVVAGDRGWHVEGAILGLDAALAALALRRLDVDVIPMPPRIDATLRRRFVIDAARARWRDFDDADRDVVAEALGAGRARAEQLAADGPGAAETLSDALGLDARRVQGLAWALAHGDTDMTSRLAPSELVRLGAARPLPFDVATVPAEACPKGAPACPRELTDLALVLVDGLAARRLPAALLPAILGAATQDFVEGTQPLHPDDLRALWTWAARLPRARVDDYIAASEAYGPLRAAAVSDDAGLRRGLQRP